jgi:hypothetical protein
MEVRHDSTLLKRAVEHVVRQAEIPSLKAEAEATAKKTQAKSRLRLATGGAIALAAVGLGLGISLALTKYAAQTNIETAVETPSRVDEQRAPPIPPRRPELPAEQEPKRLVSPQPEPTRPPDIFTENFTKFVTREIDFLGSKWRLTAGHHFDSEKQLQWSNSWCYTNRDVDDVDVRVQLAERETFSASPMAPLASHATLVAVGLSQGSAIALATECPWLDEKSFSVTEFQPLPGEHNPFQPTRPRVTLQGRTLIYSGEIAEDFTNILNKHEFEELQITSLGGLVSAGIDGGTWLRRNGKTVKAESECLSACVLVLAGGARRTADGSTMIGVHRFHTKDNTDARGAMEIAQQISSVILQYLDKMGIDSKLFHRMSAVPSDSIEYINHNLLKDWRLLSVDENRPVVIIPEKQEQDWSDAPYAFMRASSSPLEPALRGLQEMYATKVQYYGKLVSRAKVLEEKRAFFERWPERQYTISSETMTIDCSPRSVCNVSFVASFNAYSPARNKSSVGKARFTLAISKFGRRAVELETSEVLSRRHIAGRSF